MLQPKAAIKNVRVWITYNGHRPDRMTEQLGSEPKIDRNLPRNVILDRWKQEMAIKFEEWREIIAQMCDEEEEYGWTDRHDSEAKAPWMQGKLMLFKLEPWTTEISARRLAKRPPSPDGARAPYDHPHSVKGTDDGSSAPGAEGTAEGPRKVSITLLYEETSCQFKVNPRTAKMVWDVSVDIGKGMS
jgi:hypothetical protein